MTRYEHRFSEKQREELARRVKEFRRRNLMTQEDVAKALQMSRGTIGNLERCAFNPEYKTVRRFFEFEGSHKSGFVPLTDRERIFKSTAPRPPADQPFPRI